MQCVEIFLSCEEAIARGKLISRESKNDKEFHFQNWFLQRLVESGLNFDEPGRNKYPDFTLVDSPEGFEIKGLAFPGRVNNYDCNSQVPMGLVLSKNSFVKQNWQFSRHDVFRLV